jgi:hypothetical protein
LGDAKQVLPVGSGLGTGFGVVGHEMKQVSRLLESH